MSQSASFAISRDEFLEKFSKEVEAETAAIFAGAGLSVDAGFVNWRGLLEPFAREIGLDVHRETDLVRLAQFHVNRHNNRSSLDDAILNEFTRRHAKVTRSHEILASLPIRTYWTTNYDPSIENALRAAGKLPDVKFRVKSLPVTVRNRDAVVYKMHGDYQSPDEAVLTKKEYERYHLDRGQFLEALSGDLISKTFLFIGFSFTDPNLDYVLSRLHAKYGEHQRPHYCFVKEESAQPDDKPGDLEYRQSWQEHFIRDLQRYSIRAVKIERYEDVPAILEELAARYRRKSVFISGAAHVYGDKWSSAEALQYVFDLSSGLIKADCRLVTGFGLGIGATVVNGALHQIYNVQNRRLKDELVLRPFPQGTGAPALWTKYRQDILDMAGIAIFMFGNKTAGDLPALVNSSGLREEFEIAVQKGLKVLPLGFSGYMARELYDEVGKNFSTYYPKAGPSFQAEFQQLGDPNRSPADQLRTTLSAIRALQTM